MSPRRVAEDSGPLVDEFEADLAELVAEILGEIAAQFATELSSAGGDITAAFSVSRITGMWASRTDRLLRPLMGVYEAGARWLATGMGGALPDGWDGLPARVDSGNLPDPAAGYLELQRAMLDEVGARLGERAAQIVAGALDDEISPEQLEARLLKAFAEDGGQLGPGRAQRVARTEANRAWNRAALDAAEVLPEGERPTVKQWKTRRDTRVRAEHAAVDGQIQLLTDPFNVADTEMTGPGDPAAPPHLTINCRCELRFAGAPSDLQSPGGESRSASTIEVSSSVKFYDRRPEAVQARKAAGVPKPRTALKAADGTPHTGAMIALVPTTQDAERLSVENGEATEELHLTLMFLGEGAAYDEASRTGLVQMIGESVGDYLPGPIVAGAFGVNHWNTGSDSPSWVYAVGDEKPQNIDTETPPGLNAAHALADYAVTNGGVDPALIPPQYTPWQPHVCAAYSDDPVFLADMESRLGPVTFDRIRVSFAGEYTDIPLDPNMAPPADVPPADAPPVDVVADGAADIALPAPVAWSTPGDTAIAFENQETGDGRIFAPGSLYWENGPWPLQYADEMLSGHEGAELAGAIAAMDRDGDRIASSGILYPDRWAGADAIMLLEQNAPLGVSVDLDDVDIEFVDRRPLEEGAGGDTIEVMLSASLAAASVIQHASGAWTVRATAVPRHTASGDPVLASSGITEWDAVHRGALEWTTSPTGTVPRTALVAALTTAGFPVTLTAAAGDTDDPGRGELVHSESSGEVLMRITRGRVRGATLVSMPAYAEARIVLDSAQSSTEPVPEPEAVPEEVAASGETTMQRVITFVRSSPTAVGSRHVAQALGITQTQARGHLNRAAVAGRIKRLAPNQYVGAATTPAVSAALSGDLTLPLEPDLELSWDPAGAADRVLAFATAEDGTVDPAVLGSAFLWADPEADPADPGAYSLGIADVFTDTVDTGELRIVPQAVFAAGELLAPDAPPEGHTPEDHATLREQVDALYERIAIELDQPALWAPWDMEDSMDPNLEASAWSAMRETPPLPAAWFREPTETELPTNAGGVHYADGRVFGWVAQAGEPHAGFPGKNLTIESLGRIDLTHFLRARFQLDNGSSVKAGAFTMGVGHHRDGAECETAACQFDDSRTVAGIVTVGMNKRGMWFSGAAAPWLSTWDAMAFKACQPSYHMRQGRGGSWQLRAVLSVPVPGHSTPLAASGVLVASAVSRSNLALTASAAMEATKTATPPPAAVAPGAVDLNALAAALVNGTTLVADLAAAMTTATRSETDIQAARRAEIAQLNELLKPARNTLAAAVAGKTKTGA